VPRLELLDPRTGQNLLRDGEPESCALQLASRSLVRVLPAAEADELAVLFAPWRELVAFVREHPTFPLQYRYREGSIVRETVFVNPAIHFSDWKAPPPTAVAKNPALAVYPDHPPEPLRGEYTWYWALMVLMNVCHRRIASGAAKGEPGSYIDRRCWQFYNVRAPLAQLYRDYYCRYRRLPTDDAVAELIRGSPLPAIRHTHPDLYLVMPLQPHEYEAHVRTTYLVHDPPLHHARTLLFEAGLLEVGSDVEKLLAVDFGAACTFVEQRFSADER